MAITQTTDVTLDQAAYELNLRFALRPSLPHYQFMTVKPTRQSMPGVSVTFPLMSDIAAQTSALTEATDVTAVTMANTSVTVTLAEQGAAVGTTRRLKGVSYVPIDPAAANVIAFNAALSFDELAKAALVAGTNEIISGSALTAAAVTAGDNLSGNDIRKVVATLRAGNAMPWDASGSFAAIIHPNVAYDFRSDTDVGGWREPQVYGNDQTRIWNAEVGKFEGVRFIESSNAYTSADGGAGTVELYQTLVMGRECGAAAYSSTASSPMPEIRVSPVTDKLHRFNHIGWYWLGGFDTFREACIYRIASGSTIGANS